MPPCELRTDVLVVGGGLGGVAAAMTACQLGSDVILIEESDWLGGQLTTQAVPPDEHMFIECPEYSSTSYWRLREGIRSYYRRNYPLLSKVALNPCLNPGLGYVSKLCSEPRVAVAVIDEMVAELVSSGRLRVLRRHQLATVKTAHDSIESVLVIDLYLNCEVCIEAKYFLDATELGELIDLSGTEHVIGREGRYETNEPHALEKPDPLDQQAISWCFALDYRPGESHVIDKPDQYPHWRNHVADFWPGPQLSWTDVHPQTLKPRTTAIFGERADSPDDAIRFDSRWQFRRVLARAQFVRGAFESDISLVNWPQIDYWELPLIGVDRRTREMALRRSEELSLSFLYWMQTEAPRQDGGTGYPGLRLRPDVTDTAAGLAKAPYIRESRRIKSMFTILEQHIGVAARLNCEGAQVFNDSVGIGHYRIDLHPTTGGHTYVDIDCFPFQIPLGALVPVRMTNLLPACKNIGTTHITNGAYRLHPVEWGIGESAGALAAYCLCSAVEPQAVRENEQKLLEFQRMLVDRIGVKIAWPDSIRRMSYERIRTEYDYWRECNRDDNERWSTGCLK